MRGTNPIRNVCPPPQGLAEMAPPYNVSTTHRTGRPGTQCFGGRQGYLEKSAPPPGTKEIRDRRPFCITARRHAPSWCIGRPWAGIAICQAAGGPGARGGRQAGFASASGPLQDQGGAGETQRRQSPPGSLPTPGGVQAECPQVSGQIPLRNKNRVGKSRDNRNKFV